MINSKTSKIHIHVNKITAYESRLMITIDTVSHTHKSKKKKNPQKTTNKQNSTTMRLKKTHHFPTLPLIKNPPKSTISTFVKTD